MLNMLMYLHNNSFGKGYGQSSATFVDPSIQSAYEGFKQDIRNQMNAIRQRPSFDNTTITIQAGETKELIDTNGVLSSYANLDRTENGIRIRHTRGQNSMYIDVSENVDIESYTITDNMFLNWGMIKEDTINNDTTVYFEFADGVQDQLYAYHYNDPVSLSINMNIELFGKLELSKLNTNNDLIDGAVYRVLSTNGYSNDVEVRNGKITIEKLKKGTYTIRELNAPNGYLVDYTTYGVEIRPNRTSTQAIVNYEPTGELTLTKTDKDTGNNNRIDGTSHHGDATLNGAEYTLYAKEDIYNVARTIKYVSKDSKIATFTFNSYGNATINIIDETLRPLLTIENNTLKGLPLGKYYARETTTPIGYVEDNNVYDLDFIYKDQYTPIITINKTFEEIVQKAKFEVIKVSTNDNTTAEKIENAEFTAILSKYIDYYGSFENALNHLSEFAEDEYSVFRTDSNGHGTSNLLAYGMYQVRETYTPSDRIETVEDFYMNIDRDYNGVIKEFVENDLPFESYLKLIKEDKKTGKRVILSNTTFNLSKLNEETNEYEKMTCKTGKQVYDSWTTDENGIAYTETKLPAGIYKAEEIKLPNGFLVLDEPVIFEISRSNRTLEFDEDLDPYISVVLKNEQPTGKLVINKSINYRDDIDTKLIDNVDFTKIKFSLSAKEDIIDYADGSIIYEKGKEIGSYILDENGHLEIDKLPMGTYEIQETQTDNGLVLDTNKYEVKFEKKDNTTKVYTISKDIENDTTCVEISKTDITGEKELQGAKLTILDEENNIIDTWTSTDKTHKIEGLLVNKTYTLREEIAPNGYVKATDIQFVIKNSNEIQKVAMIDKVVTISKVDLTTSEELEGAELEITDKDGNIVDKWISTKEKHIVNNLIENEKYTLTEKTAPYGYEITESITFVVTTDKETQEIVMKDKPILKNIKIVKVDTETKEIIRDNFKFAIYEDINCSKIIKEVSSNKDEGTALFEELRYGRYYIKETKSPKDYEISDKIIKVEINDKGVFVDEELKEENENTISISFENKKIEVPKTSDNSYLKLAIGIIILSILGIAYLIYKIFHKKD